MPVYIWSVLSAGKCNNLYKYLKNIIIKRLDNFKYNII